MVYLGAVLGAGFASGQELTRFFAVFGPWGLCGAAGAGFGLGLAGRAILVRSAREGAASYHELLATLPWPVVRLLLPALTLFLFAGLVVMLSAGGSALASHFRLARAAATCLVALAVLGGCWWRTEGFVRMNSILVPALLVFLLAISAGTLLQAAPTSPTGPAPLPAATAGRWYWAALLYVGYNALAAGAVLPPLARLGNRAAWGALLGGTVLASLAVFCVASLQAAGLPAVDLPLLAAAHALGAIWAWSYAASFLLAVFTTAAANLFSLAQGCRAYRPALVAISGLALPLAFLPFPSLVAHLYPAFGYVGLLLLAALLLPPRRFRGTS